MVLKDASGIVKLYGMVNVESYNMVTTAASLDECFAKYRKMTGSDGTENTGNPEEAENSSGDSNSTAGNAQTAAKGKIIPEGETETRSFVISEIPVSYTHLVWLSRIKSVIAKQQELKK